MATLIKSSRFWKPDSEEGAFENEVLVFLAPLTHFTKWGPGRWVTEAFCRSSWRPCVYLRNHSLGIPRGCCKTWHLSLHLKKLLPRKVVSCSWKRSLACDDGTKFPNFRIDWLKIRTPEEPCWGLHRLMGRAGQDGANLKPALYQQRGKYQSQKQSKKYMQLCIYIYII